MSNTLTLRIRFRRASEASPSSVIFVPPMRISDAAVEHLRTHATLRVLLIGKSRITEEGAKALQAAIPEISFSEQT